MAISHWELMLYWPGSAMILSKHGTVNLRLLTHQTMETGFFPAGFHVRPANPFEDSATHIRTLNHGPLRPPYILTIEEHRAMVRLRTICIIS